MTYVLIDYLREAVKDNRAVEPWYRYNILLFVKRDMIDSLPDELLRHRVANADPVVDISPYPYQLRKRIISVLPRWACSYSRAIEKAFRSPGAPPEGGR